MNTYLCILDKIIKRNVIKNKIIKKVFRNHGVDEYLYKEIENIIHDEYAQNGILVKNMLDVDSSNFKYTINKIK